MDRNTDRLGFALIALSVVAVILIIMNTIFGTTVKGIYKGLQTWANNSFNGLDKSKSEANGPKKQYTHKFYSWTKGSIQSVINAQSYEQPYYNLLKGTTISKSIAGSGGANVNGLLYGFDNGSSVMDQGFKVGDTVAIEFDWKANHASAGTFIMQWHGTPWGISMKPISINSMTSGHVRYTFTFRDVDAISVAPGLGYRIDNVPTDNSISFSNVSIRSNSSAVGWAPAQSDISSGLVAESIGTYTDTNVDINKNYDKSKMTWVATSPDVTHTAYANNAEGTLDFNPDYKSAVGLDVLNITNWAKNDSMSRSTYKFVSNADSRFKVTGKGTANYEVLSKSFPAKVGDKLRFTVSYTNRQPFAIYEHYGLQFIVNDAYTESFTTPSKIVLPNKIIEPTEYQLEYTVKTSNVWMELNFGMVVDQSQVDSDIKIEVENLTNPVKYAYRGSYKDNTATDSPNPSDYTWSRM